LFNPHFNYYIPKPTTMSKYYEVVSMDQKPDKDGWYYVLNPNQEILPRMIEFKGGSFHNHNKVLASYYLKPLSVVLSIRDKELQQVIDDMNTLAKMQSESMGWLVESKKENERLKGSVEQIRDELYEATPTGKVEAFELIKIISAHIRKLDALTTPVE
jgi:hypothetical protein